MGEETLGALVTAPTIERAAQQTVELPSDTMPEVPALPAAGRLAADLHWQAMQVGSEEPS